MTFLHQNCWPRSSKLLTVYFPELRETLIFFFFAQAWNQSIIYNNTSNLGANKFPQTYKNTLIKPILHKWLKAIPSSHIAVEGFPSQGRVCFYWWSLPQFQREPLTWETEKSPQSSLWKPTQICPPCVKPKISLLWNFCLSRYLIEPRTILEKSKSRSYSSINYKWCTVIAQVHSNCSVNTSCEEEGGPCKLQMFQLPLATILLCNKYCNNCANVSVTSGHNSAA